MEWHEGVRAWPLEIGGDNSGSPKSRNNPVSIAIRSVDRAALMLQQAHSPTTILSGRGPNVRMSPRKNRSPGRFSCNLGGRIASGERHQLLPSHHLLSGSVIPNDLVLDIDNCGSLEGVLALLAVGQESAWLYVR